MHGGYNPFVIKLQFLLQFVIDNLIWPLFNGVWFIWSELLFSVAFGFQSMVRNVFPINFKGICSCFLLELV